MAELKAEDGRLSTACGVLNWAWARPTLPTLTANTAHTATRPTWPCRESGTPRSITRLCGSMPAACGLASSPEASPCPHSPSPPGASGLMVSGTVKLHSALMG